MAVFVRRLFGIGKLPQELHAQLESEGLTYHADYVAVTRRFSGTIPGVRLQHSVASYTGSLVFTSERVLATLSMLPRLAGPTVNVRWDAPQTGAAQVEISPTARIRSARAGRNIADLERRRMVPCTITRSRSMRSIRSSTSSPLLVRRRLLRLWKRELP